MRESSRISPSRDNEISKFEVDFGSRMMQKGMQQQKYDAVSNTVNPRNFRYDCENFAEIAKIS